MTQSTAITDGKAQGQAAFRANAGTLNFGTSPPVPNIQIVPNGQSLTASLTYTTTGQDQFGRMFGTASTQVSGATSSSSIITPYYQFIFLVDISGSMSIGGTTADINGLVADPRIQCAFACHDPNHGDMRDGEEGRRHDDHDPRPLSGHPGQPGPGHSIQDPGRTACVPVGILHAELRIGTDLGLQGHRWAGDQLGRSGDPSAGLGWRDAADPLIRRSPHERFLPARTRFRSAPLDTPAPKPHTHPACVGAASIVPRHLRRPCPPCG